MDEYTYTLRKWKDSLESLARWKRIHDKSNEEGARFYCRMRIEAILSEMTRQFGPTAVKGLHNEYAV